MKKQFAVFVLMLSIPLTALAVPEESSGGGRGRGPNMERLTKELNLTDEQKTQLETIFKEQRAKHKALREEGHTRMREVLNQEQMKKLDEMRKARHQRWKQRRHCDND
jgi:periplasmic protein CpxP/Spy